jgi:hypothetical protein
VSGGLLMTGQAQAMKMKWLSRQHFRDNWPLWLAGFAIVFSLICLLYTETVP